MKALLVGSLLGLVATTAQSDIVVAFKESAPKDSFSIVHNGGCPLDNVRISLDIGATPAGLIFDVTAAGAGVSVFQPLELTEGGHHLVSVPQVEDGDTRIDLNAAQLPAGARISFTIDVDDTAGTSATRVSDAEIEGAIVTVVANGAENSGRFDNASMATVALQGCLS